MRQYVYGNVGHKGFDYLSSDPLFFKDPKRTSAMQKVNYYNKNIPHGELTALEHQCYWMVTSDLDLKTQGEPDHLFLQASGLDVYRDSSYLHGYCLEDTEGPYLYGPRLLELLKLDFMDLDQIDQVCWNGTLPNVDPPVKKIEPMKLDGKTLKAILHEILLGKKVALQLPCQGKAAMDQSRALLLTIYQHLPYAQRRSTGFLTGATAAEVLSLDMPAGIKLFLLDGDADLTNLGSTENQVFWRLDRIPEIEISQTFERLFNFLIQDNAQKLDAFFAYCKKLTEAGGAKQPKLFQYAFYMDCFQHSGERITDGDIRNWAVNLYGGQYDNIKKELVQQIASFLPADRLEEYLGAYAVSLASLSTFGILNPAEKAQAAKARAGKDDIQDPHVALTLEMAELMLPYYAEQEKEKLHKGLTDRFLTSIEAEYPCLTEAKPTAATLETLDGIPIQQLPGPGRKIASAVRYAVFQELENLRQTAKNTYTREKQAQKEAGTDLISQWPIFCGTPDLRALYDRLEEECYLSGELLAGNEEGSWNRKIAGQLINVFSHLTLRSRGDYQGAGDWLREDLDTYQKMGGLFTCQEERAICDIQSSIRRVLALWETNCTSLKDVLVLFTQIDGMHMVPELVEERKNAFVAGLARTDLAMEELEENAETLCDTVRNHPAEKERLQALVASCDGLKVISESRNFQQAVKQGQLVLQLSKEELCDSQVLFQPDGTQKKAEYLLKQLNTLKSYTSEQPLDISQPCMVRWLIQNLSQNRALMVELARRDPSLGEMVMVPIAACQEPVSADIVRNLYYAGWSRQTLLKGAGVQTSEAWNQGLASVFPFHFWHLLPEWNASQVGGNPEIPESASPKERHKRHKRHKRKKKGSER